MSYEDDYYYYYYEEEIIVTRDLSRLRRRHSSHIWEEEYADEEEGAKRAKVYEEILRDEIRYYVELPGVTSPDDINIVVDGAMIRITAKLKKAIIYPGLRKRIRLSEYKAEIRLPFRPQPDEIYTEFDKNRSLLIIRVKKKSKSFRIGINHVY